MPRTDAALLRIVARLDAERLARSAALTRTALKDFFPDDPLVVSILTAAIEQGVLVELLDRQRAVPIDVLGPRLASGLRRSTGISERRAQWAVAAWAHAVGRTRTEVPDLPRDGSEPVVAGLFDPGTPRRVSAAARPAPAGAAGVTAPPEAETAVVAPATLVREPTVAPPSVPATAPVVEPIVEPVEVQTEVPTAAPTVVPPPAAEPVTPKPARKAAPAKSEQAKAAAKARAAARATAKAEAAAAAAAIAAAAAAHEVETQRAAAVEAAATVTAPTATQVDSSTQTAARTLQFSADAPTAETVVRSPEPDTVERPAEGWGGAAATVVRPDTPAAPTPQRATDPQPPVPVVPPPGATPAAPEPGARKPRRRRGLLIAVLVAVVVLAAAGITAAVALHGVTPLAMSKLSATATITTDGDDHPLTAKSTLSNGSIIEVSRGPLELVSGSSVVRLATGSHVRVDGPTSITLLTGRAFVNAASTSITMRDAAGSATVGHARLLAGCVREGQCNLTTLNEPVRATVASKTITLLARQSVEAKGVKSFIAPDALRSDSWVTANDALDTKQSRALKGVTGVSVLGDWILQVSRGDLPVRLDRTIHFYKSCGSDGCAVVAEITASDDTDHDRMIGRVVVNSSTGRTFSIDYGSHSARCQYIANSPSGADVDGNESVADTYSVAGSGTDATVTGTRTTRYTPTGARCTLPALAEPHSASITGKRGVLTDAGTTGLSTAAQQMMLNYVASSGTGCATGTAAPSVRRIADVQCKYASGSTDGPTTVEYASYSDAVKGAIRLAYDAAVQPYGLSDSGTCSTGPCERVGPNNGRVLITTDGGDAVLITFDPAASRLLVIARGSSMRGLSAWWSAQQKSHSVYSAAPFPRVGV